MIAECQYMIFCIQVQCVEEGNPVPKAGVIIELRHERFEAVTCVTLGQNTLRQHVLRIHNCTHTR